MPLILQYRAVAILAVVSAFATIFYLSLSTDLDNTLHRDMTMSYSPQDSTGDQRDSTLYKPSYSPQQASKQTTKENSVANTPSHQQEQQEQQQHHRPTTFSRAPSDHNSRVAKLHAEAFVSFCNSATDSSIPSASIFQSYEDWMGFVDMKNTKIDGVNDSSEPVAAQQRPIFFERPPPHWIMNLTALEEPCDRFIHTSAHCLDALSKEHQYLIPATDSSSASTTTTLIKPKSSVTELPENHRLSFGDDINENVSQDTTATSSATSSMDFHVFWRGPITDKLSLNAHAFLFTQPLDRARLHLWIDSADLPGRVPEDYLQNKFAAPLVQEPLSRYIILHPWDQAAELAYSYGSIEGAAATGSDANVDDENEKVPGPTQEASTPNEQVKPVALSDEARFLILNRNGGIYLDADVVLLRDMSPFYESEIEFAYEWSNTRMYNTAILRLLPGSSVARRILDGAKAREVEIMEKKRLEALLRQQEKQDIEMDGDDGASEGEDKGPEASQSKTTDGKDFVRQPKTSVRSKKNMGKKSRSRNSNTTASRRKAELLKKRGEMRPDEIYHPARLRKYLRPKDSEIEGNGLVMMPPAFFDPLWLRVDRTETKKTMDTDKMLEDLHTFPDAFFASANAVCPAAAPANLMISSTTRDNEHDNDTTTTTSKTSQQDFTAGPEVFFTGAYAYHWHNNWLTPIDSQSWMGLMRQAYDDFVAGKRPNLYGEFFLQQK